MKKPLIIAAMLCGCLFANQAFAAEGRAFGKEPGFRPTEKITINPVVNLGLFWDSNANDARSKHPNQSKNDAWGWRIQPAISIGYNESEKTTFGLNAFYTAERGFKKEDSLDSDSWGESLFLQHQLSKKWSFRITQFYTRSENDNFYYLNGSDGIGSIDTQKSDHYGLNGALTYRPTELWTHSISVGWTRTKYLTGSRNESDSYSATYMLGWNFSEKMTWNNSVTVTRDDPDSGDQSTAYYLMTGLAGKYSQRTSWNAMVGVSIYDYSGTNTSDTNLNPTYTITAAWQATKVVSFSAALSSSYKPENHYAASNYYVWNHSLLGAMNVTFNDKWTGRVDASVNCDMHTGSGSDAGGKYDDYERTYYQLRLSTSYALMQNLSAYASLAFREETATGAAKDDGDLEAVRFDLGLTFKF